MTTDWDQDDVVRSWLRTEEGASADRILDAVFQRVETAAQRPASWTDRLPNANFSVGIVLATAVVAILAVIAVSSLPGGGFPGGPPSSGGPTPSPDRTGPAEPTDIVGIPPEGTSPSETSPTELVLRFEGNVTSPGSTLLVYADGRLVSSQFGRAPEKPLSGFIGLTEQRLSPIGVAFLKSEALATGLFEHDLDLARERGAFLQIRVRNGEDLVSVQWWFHGTAGGAPVATAEQEQALRDLNALFTDPASWPGNAWQDQTVEAYVPSRYAVCLGVRPPDAGDGEWAGTMDPEPIWALLPDAAEELLRAAEPAPREGMHADAGCSGLTTDEARELAQILEGAGIHHKDPGGGHYWLAYDIEDPETGDMVLIQFGPVLPDGTATYLGPG
jgi:hypothetical protein